MDTQAIREHAKWVLVVRVEELEDWHKRLRDWAASHPQLDVPLEFDRGEVNKRVDDG
jgi:hypothetical protein